MQPLPDQAPAPTADAKHVRPLLPQDDPFFAPPAELGLLAPGEIIRSREVELAFLGLIPQQVSAWQLVYRSTDLHGAPEAAVTTVVLPEGADPDVPRPLLAYQCAIDAISGKAFPSYSMRRGARSWGSIPPLEFSFLAGMLRKGWALSIADHEGLLGRFGAAREPGYRVLDGIRAALDFEALGLQDSTPVGIMGYSGGGMASSWAAEMAPSYAPELNIVGAALGAPVGDPAQTFIRLNGTFHAGLPAMVVAGLRSGYPGLSSVIHEHASFQGRKRLQRLEKCSTLGAVVHHRGDDFDNYLDAPLADVLATPEIQYVFGDLRLGQNIPTCPILMTQALHDQIIHVEDVDGQHDRYVEGGATVRYVRDRFSEHLSLHPLALPLMINWMADRFAGKPAPSGTRTVFSVALSIRSLWGYVGMVSGVVRTVAGLPLRGR
ncbi:lipase family protein [Nocardioides sp. WS12]|uniref:lipase family protein n=1 Tax=Nocardioides sp. WS12 TaxID=2486272 RepID=UPI0015FDA11C|nr:lipase family protein [Nocardioides sp. WS12]